jgi:predicted permease
MPDESLPANPRTRQALWSQEVRARLEGVPLSPAREAEIIEELSQHLDDRWRELVACGVQPDVAKDVALAELRADALARYLSPLRQARWVDPSPPTANQWLSIDGLVADLRQAVRALRVAPGFTIAALVVLTLGIGATTAIFSVVDAVVFRPLPFDEPDRLVALGERPRPSHDPKNAPLRNGPGKGTPIPAGKPRPVGPRAPGMDANDPQSLMPMQPQNFLDILASQQSFTTIAAAADAEFALQLADAAPEDAIGRCVTASFFDVLRIRPAIGRLFTADNEVDGSERVAVVSDAFWRQRLGGAANVLGQSIRLDGESYEVIGILPPQVTYPVGASRTTELWVPYVIPEEERTRGRGVGLYLHVIGRLKPGTTLEQAQADLVRIADAVAVANPGAAGLNLLGARPLRDHFLGASIRSWMVMLLIAVAIVLVIACANVANLLLARAAAREREVAVRAALGAARWRLVRQLLVESLVLAGAATVAGVMVAWWMVHVLRGALPEDIPRVTSIALDLRVLLAAIGVSLVTGLLFGIAPALQFSRPNLTAALNDGARGVGSGRGRQRLRTALVIGEIALAVVLVIGAALFIGSFMRVMHIDPGFAPDRVITMQIYAPPLPGTPPRNWSGPFQEIIERLAATPGVAHASAVSPGIPLSVRMRLDGLTVPGKAFDGDPSISLKAVTSDYHRAMGIPLKAGRLFDERDGAGNQPVMILNEAAAKTFFAGEDPVGRTAVISRVERTIVGIVADVRQWSLEAGARTEVYLPMAQVGSGTGYLVIQTKSDPGRMLPAIKTVVAEVLPKVPLRYVATMDDLVARQTAGRRLNMMMLGLFGLLGLVIATVGVYGVMAYSVAQRTREIGVRMALGATRARVIGMVLSNAGLVVVAGLAIGCLGAWSLSAFAKSFLFGLEPTDVRAFVAAAGSLSLAALLAAAIPARRAARLDPASVLRE